jgi:4-amino-4-deoxy-L-arabinose transferase-like glycosyltransferase
MAFLARLRALPSGAKWALALFLVLGYFPLFLHLDTLPARLFDESRQALSALEMLRTGDWLVTRYQGLTDLYNTKPPLLFWLITASYALLGPGELAMRLPVAILAWLTCFVLLRYVWRLTGSPWTGLFAALILLTSGGYVTTHVARTADFDAPMIFFMFTSMVLIHRWSRAGDGHLVFWSLVLLSLGVFTKSVQAMLYLPGILFALIWERRLVPLLKERWTYIGAGFFLLLIGGFLVLREGAEAGYLEAVLYNDITGRAGQALDGHAAPPEFYIKLLYTWQFNHWWWMSLLGAALGLAHRDETIRSWTRWLVCISVCYLVAITSARTKMEWYNAPLLPLLAALAAIPLHVVMFVLKEERITPSFLAWRVLPATLAILIFTVPYLTMLGKVYKPKENAWDWTYYDCAYAIRRVVRNGDAMVADVLCYSGDRQHLNFQVALLKEMGLDMLTTSRDELRPGMTVMLSQPEVEEWVQRRFHHLLLEQKDALRVYRLLAEKRNEAPSIDPTAK